MLHVIKDDQDYYLKHLHYQPLTLKIKFVHNI